MNIIHTDQICEFMYQIIYQIMLQPVKSQKADSIHLDVAFLMGENDAD